MKKNVWIFNHYATDMFNIKAGRHYMFSKYLKKAGYNPTIFCANTVHNSKKNIDLSEKKYVIKEDENSKFVFVKTPTYHNNGLDRIKNMLMFFFNMFKVTKKYTAKNEKPDIIIASSPHLLTCIAGLYIAKRYRVKCVVEVRDLWPAAIIEYSSRLTEKSLIAKLMYKVEKWIYKKADNIIFTMEGGADYIKEKGWDNKIDISKIFHINNGVDLERFDYNKEHFRVEDDELEDKELYKVVYTGSIRSVNNLGVLLDAAKKIIEPKVRILIWGDGNELEMLKKRVVDENIKNVVFKGNVEKEYVPYIVSKSDCNYVAGNEIIENKYGSSQNKLFDYIAAGNAVLYREGIRYNLLEKDNCAIIYGENELHLAIEKMVRLGEEGKRIMREIAVKYDFENLSATLIRLVESE